MLIQSSLKIIISFFLLSLLSCDRDNQEIVIHGKITDPDQNIAVQDVQIRLDVIEIQNGAWSQNYSEKATTLSASDGSYEFHIPFFYTIAYRLQVDRNNYFSETINLDDSDFENYSCTNDIEIHPQSTLRIHIKNDFPYNEQDRIRFRIKDWDAPYEGCCPSGYTELQGMNINEFIECKVIGNQTYSIEYTFTRNNNSNVGLKEVFCTPFQTTLTEINF
jgi:hypothetical protein